MDARRKIFVIALDDEESGFSPSRQDKENLFDELPCVRSAAHTCSMNWHSGNS